MKTSMIIAKSLVVFEILLGCISTTAIGQPCAFNEVTFAAGGSFSGPCVLEVGDMITITGHVIISHGTIKLNNSAGTSANLTIANGGVITVQDFAGLNLSDQGTFLIQSGGVIDIQSIGFFTTTGTGDNVVQNAGVFESYGNVNLGGDLIIDGGDVVVGGGKFAITRFGGDGDVVVLGDGTLKVDAILDVQDDMTIASGATGYISVEQGANIDVTGDVNILGGTVMLDGLLNAGGTVGFGGGAGGTLIGTIAGSGSLMFGAYTPDLDCPYSAGSIDFCSCTVSGCLSILPIELSAFVATQEGGIVRLSWITQSEINNDYFEVERLNLTDDSFDLLGQVPGSGTSTEPNQYSFFDVSPIQGKNYYRLRQVDFDGTVSYSDIEMVEVERATDVITVHPNPATGGTITIEGRHPETNDSVLIEIKSLLGLVLHSYEVQPDSSGAFSWSLDANGLKAGCYLVTVGSTGTRLFIR